MQARLGEMALKEAPRAMRVRAAREEPPGVRGEEAVQARLHGLQGKRTLIGPRAWASWGPSRPLEACSCSGGGGDTPTVLVAERQEAGGGAGWSAGSSSPESAWGSAAACWMCPWAEPWTNSAASHPPATPQPPLSHPPAPPSHPPATPSPRPPPPPCPSPYLRQPRAHPASSRGALWALRCQHSSQP